MKIGIKNLKSFKQLHKYKDYKEFKYRGEMKQFDCPEDKLLQACNDMEKDKRVNQYTVKVDVGYQGRTDFVVRVSYFC